MTKSSTVFKLIKINSDLHHFVFEEDWGKKWNWVNLNGRNQEGARIPAAGKTCKITFWPTHADLKDRTSDSSGLWAKGELRGTLYLRSQKAPESDKLFVLIQPTKTSMPYFLPNTKTNSSVQLNETHATDRSEYVCIQWTVVDESLIHPKLRSDTSNDAMMWQVR